MIEESDQHRQKDTNNDHEHICEFRLYCRCVFPHELKNGCVAAIKRQKKQETAQTTMTTAWKHTAPYQAFTLWSTLLNTTTPPGQEQRKWNADTRKLDLAYVQCTLPRVLHPIQRQQQDFDKQESKVVDALLETGGDVHQINSEEQTCGIQLIVMQKECICKLPTFVLETDDDTREIAVAIRRAGVCRPNLLVINTPNRNNAIVEHLQQVYCSNREYFGIVVRLTRVPPPVQLGCD